MKKQYLEEGSKYQSETRPDKNDNLRNFTNKELKFCKVVIRQQVKPNSFTFIN